MGRRSLASEWWGAQARRFKPERATPGRVGRVTAAAEIRTGVRRPNRTTPDVTRCDHTVRARGRGRACSIPATGAYAATTGARLEYWRGGTRAQADKPPKSHTIMPGGRAHEIRAGSRAAHASMRTCGSRLAPVHPAQCGRLARGTPTPLPPTRHPAPHTRPPYPPPRSCQIQPT